MGQLDQDIRGTFSFYVVGLSFVAPVAVLAAFGVIPPAGGIVASACIAGSYALARSLLEADPDNDCVQSDLAGDSAGTLAEGSFRDALGAQGTQAIATAHMALDIAELEIDVPDERGYAIQPRRVKSRKRRHEDEQVTHHEHTDELMKS